MSDVNWISVLVSFVLMILFFLLIREIVCWYFKTTRMVRLLEEIRDLLKSTKQSN